jgi:hypothetical protein
MCWLSWMVLKSKGVVALDQGGPSTGRMARSTKKEDEALPPITNDIGSIVPSKVLPGFGQGPSLKWEGSTKAHTPCQGGKLAEEGSFLRWGEGKRTREGSSHCREERVN